MSDEIYGEILYDGAEHVSLLRYPVDPRPADPARRLEQDLCDDRLAAWAMGCGPRRCSRHAERLAINCHSCVNAAAQFAGIAALDRPARAGPAHGRAPLPSGARCIVAALNGLPGFRCAKPGRRLLHLPQRQPAPGSTRARCKAGCSKQAGVATIAGTSFGAFGEGYLRFSYANSREAIGEAIERIRTLLGQSADLRC